VVILEELRDEMFRWAIISTTITNIAKMNIAKLNIAKLNIAKCNIFNLERVRASIWPHRACSIIFLALHKTFQNLMSFVSRLRYTTTLNAYAKKERLNVS
jgi:hypothetical protein